MRWGRFMVRWDTWDMGVNAASALFVMFGILAVASKWTSSHRLAIAAYACAAAGLLVAVVDLAITRATNKKRQ